MKVLELFSGTGSFSNAAKKRGHEVFTIDIDGKLDPDLNIDINNLKAIDIPFHPDIIWASPPCQKFSIASVYRHWKDGKPRHQGTVDAIKLVEKTINIIQILRPKFFFIENPRGMMRKLDCLLFFYRRTVTYCKYGFPYQKATDIWTNCLEWNPRETCSPGSPCHVRAPKRFKNRNTGSFRFQGKQESKASC